MQAQKYDKHTAQKKPKVSRSSKISNALRKNFIDSIVITGMNIKMAARKFNINYSTAKVIYRKYCQAIKSEEKNIDPQKFQEKKLDRLSYNPKNQVEKQRLRCDYKQEKLCESTGSESTQSSRKNKIQVISTVAWNFVKNGAPIPM